MKNNLKKPSTESLPCILKVEIRISTELESLYDGDLTKLEQVIVTSVSNSIKSSIKKDPEVFLISNLTLSYPSFRNEARYLVEIVPNSPSSR